jgi:hypothetical protein
MTDHLDPDKMTTEELEAAITAESERESSGNAGGGLTPEGYEDPTPKPATTDPIMGASQAQETQTPGPEEDETLFPINVRGEIKHVTFEKLVDLAQQGDDYNVKSAEVNKRKAELDRLQEELNRRMAGPAYPGPAPYPYPGQGYYPPAPNPEMSMQNSRALFEEDPVIAARMVAESSTAPLRAELAELKASQHPMWKDIQPEYQSYRHMGMGVDEAVTRAELEVLRRELDGRKKAETNAEAKKRALARASTFPTGTPGTAAVPTKKPITRKDLDKMSIEDLEARIIEEGGQVSREIR